MDEELDRLFYPESIAVVGASPSENFGKLPYYQIIKGMRFQGRIYPVNPACDAIDGVRVYPSLEVLPEPVDLAIVSVSARMALEILESAIKRKTGFVHFFSSGFSETGDDSTEKAMCEMVKGTETRIVGPNCLGVHCTESRVIYDPVFTQTGTGKVALLSQSGGLTNNLLRLAQARFIPVNKAVSYGNQIDIRVEEYLEYFVRDAQITAIAAYIEDTKDARTFLNVLRKATKEKPVVILKGGITKQGARATASHTAALALDPRIWSAALRQHGAIEVHTLEEMLDVIQMGTATKLPQGPGIGFVTAGGGASVLFTDLANMYGLVLPGLGKSTKKRIRDRISDVNTSINNPVDLGASGFDFNVVTETMKALDEDSRIDAIIPFFCLDFINSFLSDQMESGAQTLLETVSHFSKPVIPVLTNYAEDDFQVEQAGYRIYQLFRGAGLPVYRTIQDAALAIHKMLEWRR